MAPSPTIQYPGQTGTLLRRPCVDSPAISQCGMFLEYATGKHVTLFTRGKDIIRRVGRTCDFSNGPNKSPMQRPLTPQPPHHPPHQSQSLPYTFRSGPPTLLPLLDFLFFAACAISFLPSITGSEGIQGSVGHLGLKSF